MDFSGVIDDLRRDEGWRELAYDDATGTPVRKGDTLQGYVTVGWGFCLDADRGRPLPRVVGDVWLEHILREKVHLLRDRWPAFWDQPADVQRALANMAYQLGVNGVLRFRKMISALEKDDRLEAARQALDSSYARQTPARAKRVATLIRGQEE